MTKILLIEDDEIMRENTAEILELASFEVQTAENGRVGAKLAVESSYDLIICDIMMPELDGYGVLHIVSKNPKTSHIPFIFLTAKADKSDFRKGMDLGADDYLTKPFDDAELLNAIETRLKKVNSLKQNFSKDLQGLDSFLEKANEILKLEDLAVDRKVSNYKKKEVIFHEGDDPEYLFYVVEGKVKTFKTHDDGKEYTTHVYGADEYFGVFPLFDDSSYKQTALTMENTKICKIPKKDFINLIYQNKDVASEFIKRLSNRVEESEEKLLSFAYDTVRKRTAIALVNLYQKIGNKDEHSIKVTRDDLASMIATATETVIRCLSDFKEEGLISTKGREIILNDIDALEKLKY